MQTYYSITNNENVERIVKEGLRTGADLGYKPRKYHNTICDNNFVYLSKTPNSLNRWFTNVNKSLTSLISLHLPNEHPLERDLDTHVVISGQDKSGPSILEAILQEMNINLSPKELIQISKDKKKIQELFAGIPDYKWDKVFGFYRTPANIPPASISGVERCDQNFASDSEYLSKLIIWESSH